MTDAERIAELERALIETRREREEAIRHLRAVLDAEDKYASAVSTERVARENYSDYAPELRALGKALAVSAKANTAARAFLKDKPL